MPRSFTFFNYEDPVEITRRNLPHWEQPDVCYFLTFRTADSLPAEVMTVWKAERDLWLRSHNIDSSHEDWHADLAMLKENERQEFHRTFSTRMHEMLDAGHGECLLRRADFRGIVVEALHHFDEDRYRLGGFVVMPNHAHVLVQCLGETRLKKMGYSWKHFSARKINKALAKEKVARESLPERISNESTRRESRAMFWQAETYDHIVRSPEQFGHYRRYIAENPSKAKLREAEFTLFLPEVNGSLNPPRADAMKLASPIASASITRHRAVIVPKKTLAMGLASYVRCVRVRSQSDQRRHPLRRDAANAGNAIPASPARACAGSVPGRHAIHYFAGTGTGITSFPSFSATGLFEVPEDEPSALFVSDLMTSCFVILSGIL